MPGNCYQKKMSFHDLSKDVLLQLEYPVCTQYMLLPITLCGNWRNTCSNCKQKIQKCLTYSESLSDRRNKALEKLAIRVGYPCSNDLYGCTLTFSIALICACEDVCQFGPFDCPLNYRIKCNWTGPLIEIKGHVLHKHKEPEGLLGLTKPSVKNFKKYKIYDDILLPNVNLFFRLMRS